MSISNILRTKIAKIGGVQIFSVEYNILERGGLLIYLVPLLNAGSVFGRVVSQAASRLISSK